MLCGADGVAAGCGASSGGLGELGAGQGSGGSGPGATQPGQAVLSQPPSGWQSEADLGPAGPALSRVPEPQVGHSVQFVLLQNKNKSTQQKLYEVLNIYIFVYILKMGKT